jgi:hypothetical protein
VEVPEGKGGCAEVSVVVGKAGMGAAAEEGATLAFPLSGRGGKAGAEPLGAVDVVGVPSGISGRGGISCPRTQLADIRKAVVIKNRLIIPQLLGLAGEKVPYFRLNSISRR